jgi:hypothetical protein
LEKSDKETAAKPRDTISDSAKAELLTEVEDKRNILAISEETHRKDFNASKTVLLIRLVPGII